MTETKLCALCKKKYSHNAVKFFTVPQAAKQLQRWIKSCGKKLYHDSLVCELHFAQSDFKDPITKSSLRFSAAPSLAIRKHRVKKEEKPPSPDPEDAKPARSQSVTDVTVQTENSKECYEQAQFQQLKKKLTKLKAEVDRYRRKERIEKVLKANLQNPQWTEDDKTHAICLYSGSPQSYKYFYEKKGALPDCKSAELWCRETKKNEKPDDFCMLEYIKEEEEEEFIDCSTDEENIIID